MSDHISRDDAIEAVCGDCTIEQKDKCKTDGYCYEVKNLMALPSAEAEYADLPDIPRYYYEKVVGNMAHEINMLKEQLESADAVQGEWIEKYNGNGWNDFWDYTCSNCGKKYERADAVLYHANYCPNCGAKMKGGDE